MDGPQAGPGEIAHLAGDLVGVEVLAELDEPPARSLGKADEGVGDRASVLGFDVDGDEWGDGVGRLVGDVADRRRWNSSSRRVPPP